MPVAALPKYEQVKRKLIAEIEQGRWGAGETVPSEAELVQRFNVSRPTLVRSLQDLVRDGYVVRRQGKGTFVAERRGGRMAESKAASTCLLPVFISRHTAGLSGSAREVLLRMMRGIQSALESTGMELALRSAPNEAIDADTQRFIDEHQPGPALIIEPSFNRQLRRVLTERGWRVWCMNEPVEDGHCIFIDQEQAGYLATRYLLDHGRRRIALLNGPLWAYWGFAARLEGYRRALAEAGVAEDPGLVLEADHVIDSEAGRAMMRQLLEMGVAFDAVVGASDSKAIGAMAAAEEAGRRVPEQIMFMSIDNTLADRCGKPLSAVSMPFEELGRCAATQALGPAAQTPFHAHIRLKPTLVERNEGT